MSTLYFENFDKSYDIFEKEGLNYDDLLIKSKLGFYNGKYTFSNKSKFNFGSRNSGSHEFEVKHKCQRAEINLKHKSNGETTIEADAKCGEKDNLTFRTYSKFVLECAENKRNVDATLMFRFLNKNNTLFSLGVENWKPLEGQPETVTAYTSYGHSASNGLKLIFNSYFLFNIVNKYLPLAKIVVHGEKGDINGYLQANLNRARIDTDDKENPVTFSNSVNILAKIVKTLDSKRKVGTSIGYNVDDKTADFALFGSHQMDRVKLNAKLTSNRELSLGVTSVFDDITLNFSAGSELKSAVEKIGENESKKHWVDCKFGLTLEFNRL